MQQPLSTTSNQSLKWYQGLDRYCWVVLSIAAMGWLFDTMDQNLMNLVRAPSVKDLLGPQNYSTPKALNDAVQQVGGYITAIFLFGWAIGGFIFGILGDRIGRARTMVLTILIYSLFTGLSGLAQNWHQYAIARFLCALGVGGEWAAGASLVAEVFPQRSRAMALGFLQALSAVGNMMASTITLALQDLDARWRWAYFVGAIPALLIFWILKSVKEPEAWYEAKKNADIGKELGAYGELFTNPKLRRNMIAAILLATAGVGGLWGVAFFSTDMIRGELLAGGLDPKQVGPRTSIMFLLQQAGAFVGIYLFAAFSEKLNRRGAFALWFALAWGSILAYFWTLHGAGANAFTYAVFLAPILGFCTLGPFSGYTVYFPELFPTRLRSTGCGFGYNAARITAAIAPLMLGHLASTLGGYPQAATAVSFVYILGFIALFFAPETKGKPLPTDEDFEIKQPSLEPALSNTESK
ncbi:MAG: MFS transporter [Bacillota bacterium]